MPYYRKPLPSIPPAESIPFPGNLTRGCSDCGLRQGCTAPVPASNSNPCQVMLVGEAPGRQEDETGIPFFGQAGQQLNYLLMQCGIAREDVSITNTVHCRPPHNREPRPDEIKACTKWLNIELGVVQPQIVVALGATAIKWFLGSQMDTVEHLHGRPLDVDGRIVLPTYHPAAALYDTSLLRFLQDDFQVLRGLLQGKTVADYEVRDEYPNPDYRIADTEAKLARVTREIAAAGQVAIDTETVNHDTKLWSVQFSTRPGTGWFVPVKDDFKGKLDCTKWGAQVIVHHYLSDSKWLDIPEDNFFDSMVAAYLIGAPQGLKELARRLCGMHMVSYSEMVRPGQQKLSLQYLTEAVKREFPNPPEIEETKWNNKKGCIVTRVKKPWHISRKITKLLSDFNSNSDTDLYARWRSIPDSERVCVESVLGVMPESSLADIKFEDAVQYATRDADATIRVKLKLEQLIHEADLDFVLHMDTAILPMVREMMDTGIAVDLKHLRGLSADYDIRMRTKAAELSGMVGHPFNPSSSKQVAAVVYGELGYRPTRMTPTGEISTDDQELKKTGDPAAKGIIEYRRLNKMKGTYADNLVRSSYPDEFGVPRIHTILTTTRVATGRLSSKKGDDGEGAALQNIPTRNKEGKAIKSGFVAPDGRLLLEGDLCQVEMRTQAHLANCKGLIDLFLSGKDPHTTTASKIFGVSYEEAKLSKYRYPCKRAGFGIIYLIGAKGLHDQITEYIADLEMEGEPVDIDAWSEEDCQKFIDDYYTLYPEIKDYQYEMAAMARRYGYTVDIVGRRRFIPEVVCPVRSVQEAGLRQAANFPVTSSAQMVIKCAMGALWRELPKIGWRDRATWLMQIHDSLLVELDSEPEFVRDFISWMRKVVCGVVDLRVPVTMDFKIGMSWGSLKEYKLEEEKK